MKLALEKTYLQMAYFVSILGILMVAIGLFWLVQPKHLVTLIERWKHPSRFWFAVLVRLVLGIVFLIVAPACRVPVVIQVFGGIAIAAALIILALGQQRLDRFIAWWLSRSPAVIRVSASFAVVFGALLVYAGPRLW